MDSLKTVPPQESKLHFLDYWRIIRIRKTIILAVFLLVVITATLVTFIYPETYSSTARIKVSPDRTDINPIDGRSYVPGTYDPYFILTEFEVIQSQAVLGKVIDELHLNQVWGAKYGGGQTLTTPETMEYLKKSMDLRQVRNTSIIEITVYSDKAEEASRIANAIAEAYKAYRLEQNREQTVNGIKALEDSWDQQEAKVHAQQEKVDKLRVELKISDPDPMSVAPAPTISADAVRQITYQLITLDAEQVRQETQLKHLEDLSRPKLREAIQTTLGTPDSELANLFSEYDLAQQKLLSLSKDMTTNNPVYQNTKKIEDDLDRKINDRVAGILIGLKNRVDAGRAALDELQQRLAEAKQSDVDLAEKSRPYYEAKQQLADLQQFNTILGMKIASEKTDLALPRSSMVEIVDRAVVSEKPASPNKTLNISLGIVIGLIVGVGLAFFIEYLDTSVKTIDDVERTLQAPVLGVIPQNVGLLLEEGVESPHAEAYRVLRTNLLFARKDDKLNSIAVVSAGAGEGKSTTVFNLATVFAQNGDRVVVVDSDLRRPTLHKMLGISNSLGVTNYLLKQNTLEEVIQTTNLPTLDFMASGKLPSSSLGILSSAQMKDLISELKQRYDYVFLDSPPIMGVSDASILASEVDMTLQVIQYRRYPQPMNIRAKQMIEKVGGNLVGIVLNNINMSQDENYYYYSGYYHEYYSKNDSDTEPSGAGESGDKAKIDIKPKY